MSQLRPVIGKLLHIYFITSVEVKNYILKTAFIVSIDIMIWRHVLKYNREGFTDATKSQAVQSCDDNLRHLTFLLAVGLGSVVCEKIMLNFDLLPTDVAPKRPFRSVMIVLPKLVL